MCQAFSLIEEPGKISTDNFEEVPFVQSIRPLLEE
jgi:hypothetical protein